jgi:hypothetical protein
LLMYDVGYTLRGQYPPVGADVSDEVSGMRTAASSRSGQVLYDLRCEKCGAMSGPLRADLSLASLSPP